MRGHHPTQLLKPPVGALGPSRSFQAAVGSGNSCQPSAHTFAGGVDGGRTSSTQAQDLSAFAHMLWAGAQESPLHSPCGNASPSSWSGSPPMSGEPPGRRPRSPRIHCDVDTTPHSCGMRGHHPTQLLKPPVGALGPSRSFQAAVGSGNSCQPSAHRLEPEGVELLLAQDLPRLGPARSKNPCAIGLVGKVCQIRIWIDFRAISLWEEVQRGGGSSDRTP